MSCSGTIKRRSSIRWIGACLLAVSCSAFSFDLRADEGESNTLIEQGIALRRDHRDLEALGLFERAYAGHSSPRAQAQVGLAEQALARWRDAEVNLRASLSASSDAWIASKRELLEDALAFVAQHLGSVVVTCNVGGAHVQIDGEKIGSTPLEQAIRVPIGDALLSVHADGFTAAERTVHVETGLTARVEMTLTPASTTSAVPAPLPGPMPNPAGESLHRAAPQGRPMDWPLIASAAVGAVGLGLGVGFGVDVFEVKAARDGHCANGFCDANGLALDARARREAWVSTGGFAVGVAATGLAGWLLWRPSSKRARATGITPTVSSRGLAIEWSGQW
jgi:hypothetical protein